ncbi:MAG TPA: ornithine cyclodeaminase family protein [Bryobacteraceae bacterium]|nr:ornithine cyclodeaminase family protein [Bryobacteraceae bacterium]
MAVWLNEADVRAVLDPAELIGTMESALAAFSSGEVVQPVRTALEMTDRSFFFVMPALYGGQGVMGSKLVTVVPENAGRGLHTHLAAIALFDSVTGELLAIMDGRYITEVRTAAVSAVSVRHLARKDARVLGILGSGVQAASHLEALPCVREFREVRVWSPTCANLTRFVAEHPGVVAAASAEDAVRGADVVVVATSSATPAISRAWVSDGAHVIAIGASRPWQQELDPALVARARLVVDSRAAALVEAGDIVGPIRAGLFGEDHVAAELGEVIAGSKPGRTRTDEVTLFKSLGLAVEDVAAAGLVYRRAAQKKMGLTLT